ncbi:MAG: hypothetical protein QG622_1571, partial [Actinomycetota bacterium]|nr:hypothetical protein [Actinomycetota bacterium]
GAHQVFSRCLGSAFPVIVREDGGMSKLGPLSGQQTGRLVMPTLPKGEPVARYDTYLEAQRAVDFLSDNEFPVKEVTIVGTGLQMVERVTGRLTYPRVALAGAASGAWFGLIFGIVLSLFGGTEGAVVAGPLFGAAAGVMFSIFSYALTGGRRDFTSASQIVASEYAVLCFDEHVGAARQLLQRLPGGIGHGEARTTGSSPSWGWPPQGTFARETTPPAPGAPQATVPQASGPEGSPVPSGAISPDTDPEPGLTYGEAIERQRRARVERERQERAEREQRERAGPE